MSLCIGTAPLPGSTRRTPCFLVGDDAFPLTTYMMKPFQGHFLPNNQRIFNYRLSRARRVIENAFGILSTKFRIFRKPIAFLPETVDKIVLAAAVLHNFLKIRDDALAPEQRVYCPPKFADYEDENGILQNGEWRNEQSNFMRNLRAPPDNILDAAENAVSMRNSLMQYFLTAEGQVPWQAKHCGFNGILQDM